MNRRVTIHLDAFSLPLEISGDYEPGHPGKVSGPPENCYEGWGESFDVTEIKIGAVTLQISDFSDDMQEEITELCIQACADQDEIAADYAYAAAREDRMFGR